MEDGKQIKTTLRMLHSDKPNIVVGRYTYGNPLLLTWAEDERITIGAFCSFARETAVLGGGEHRYDWITTSPIRIMFDLPGARKDGIPCSRGETVIGNDVWMGFRSIILSGVTVADGAVIGAGAVVANDVPPYAVVAGNPAKVIKYRFEESVRNDLLSIKWWDWPIEKIIDSVDLLCSNDADAVKKLMALSRC
ncbi:MAG: CatB-related O-acetyltransferase [Deltaproteobacteria bacterium]|nr:CatB-related O-acetyltransferase [Deltaproteobacteria bacterium]